MAPLEKGMQRDAARVAARLEAAVERIACSSHHRSGLGIAANASVNVAGDSFDFSLIEAKKSMLPPTWL
jgi:hypothetical protein